MANDTYSGKFYCVKCKEKRDFEGEVAETNGRRMAKGTCPVCGTNLFHTEEGHEDQSVGVAVGAFGDPCFPPPTDSVYDCRRHGWVTLPPGTIVFDKDPE